MLQQETTIRNVPVTTRNNNKERSCYGKKQRSGTFLLRQGTTTRDIPVTTRNNDQERFCYDKEQQQGTFMLRQETTIRNVSVTTRNNKERSYYDKKQRSGSFYYDKEWQQLKFLSRQGTSFLIRTKPKLCSSHNNIHSDSFFPSEVIQPKLDLLVVGTRLITKGLLLSILFLQLLFVSWRSWNRFIPWCCLPAFSSTYSLFWSSIFHCRIVLSSQKNMICDHINWPS